ncbi:hypothetical protein [Thiolapillus brandeum]|nr:hypothetical protein [Thiolapillus brandeum]
MDFHNPDKLEDTVADSANMDAVEKARLEGELVELQSRLPEISDVGEKARLQRDMGRILADLKRGDEAWPLCREAFEHFLTTKNWEAAADCCNLMYLSDQSDSLVALGQGVWLGVTYPINPEISVELLHHIIDDTPDDSDGAAVAAATAAFIVDVRTRDHPLREDLLFFTQQMLGKVANRHSGVSDQAQFSYWIEKLELDQPDKFLVRLRNIVDVLVQDDWWFDREALQAGIPED